MSDKNFDNLERCLDSAVNWGRAISRITKEDPEIAAKELKVRIIQDQNDLIIGYYYSSIFKRIDHGLSDLISQHTKHKVQACIRR